MKLFELYAELGLNADKFNTGITAAKGSMLGLSNDVTSKASTIDDEITALDRLIASLDEEISSLELDIETSKIEDEIKNLTKDIESQDFKTSFMKGFYEGLTDASTDIITELISKGFDFLGDSVKNASESGSEVADAYNKAFAKMELGSNNLSKAIGNKLLPALTSIYDILASILGVSDTDLASSMLGQLNSYKFENLKQAEESLANIFSFGEAYKKPEESMDLSSVLAGIESQNQYWKDYQDTIIDLQNRGISASFLADKATGAQSDYNLLSFLSDLSDADLKNLSGAVSELEETRALAAKTFSGLQLQNDSEFLSSWAEYKDLVSSLDRGGGIRFPAPPETSYTADEMEDAADSLYTLVDATETMSGVMRDLEESRRHAEDPYEHANERKQETDDSASLEATVLQLVGAVQNMTDSMATMKSDVLAAVQEGVGNISVTGQVTAGNVMLNTGQLVGRFSPYLDLFLGKARNGRG